MELTRLKSPLYAQIELTFACNLACAHCYNEPRFSSKDGLVKLRAVKKERTPAERFVEIAEELARHDVFSVTLTGGEAFTVRNSNATLITEDDTKRLRDSGVIAVVLS